MNSSHRWLIICAALIGTLVITTILLVLLVKEDKAALLPENTPEGVVQRYLVAIREERYQEAYNYLSIDPSDRITTYDDWLLMVVGNSRISNSNEWKATLGKTMQYTGTATVDVYIDSIGSGGLFEDTLRNQQVTFQLSKSDGVWLITSPIYIFWIY